MTFGQYFPRKVFSHGRKWWVTTYTWNIPLGDAMYDGSVKNWLWPTDGVEAYGWKDMAATNIFFGGQLILSTINQVLTFYQRPYCWSFVQWTVESNIWEWGWKIPIFPAHKTSLSDCSNQERKRQKGRMAVTCKAGTHCDPVSPPYILHFKEMGVSVSGSDSMRTYLDNTSQVWRMLQWK